MGLPIDTISKNVRTGWEVQFLPAPKNKYVLWGDFVHNFPSDHKIIEICTKDLSH